MYEEHFDLELSPFGSKPDPSFIFWSKTHEESLAALRYGVMCAAQLTVVTGEIGAGKTTLVRYLLGELPDWITIGLISNAQAGRGELLHWILMALHLDFGDEPYIHLLECFQDFAVECFAAGRRLILVFDEAQNLSVEMLEELRLLSNINADGETLVQVILVGQPQLRDLIRQPSMVQFAQRVRAGYHLENLNPSEVHGYIRHRLHAAGAQYEIFSAAACRLIAESTGGVPRLVNAVCDLCLFSAQELQSRTVGATMVEKVLANARKHHLIGQLKPVTQPLQPAPETSRHEPADDLSAAADSTLVLRDPVELPWPAAAAGAPAAPAAPDLLAAAPAQRPARQQPDDGSAMYWIYENPISRRALLHRAGCFYCNAGRGVGPVSGTPRGRWHGPYDDQMKATQMTLPSASELRNCKICMGG